MDFDFEHQYRIERIENSMRLIEKFGWWVDKIRNRHNVNKVEVVQVVNVSLRCLLCNDNINLTLKNMRESYSIANKNRDMFCEACDIITPHKGEVEIDIAKE